MAIKILSDKEHVLKRPAMYIGSTTKEPHERFVFGEYKTISYVPGLIKIISEVIDNSIDEAIRTNFEFANKIEVKVDAEAVTVKDNGRGIPQAIVKTPEGEEIPGPVAAWTRTKAGSNFGDDASRKTIGMNGVGSSLTNIFSKAFNGITCDGKNTISVKCFNNMDTIEWSEKKGGKQGTEVWFVPDLSHFDCTEIGFEVFELLRDQLQTLAVIYPKIEFKFNGEKMQSVFKKYAKLYNEESVIIETDNVSLAISTSPEGFRHVSYVNGVNTKNGGSHIDCVMDDLAADLIPAIKRKYKIEVNKARIKECLTMVLFVRDMSNMRFDSQTKERLTSPMGEVRSHLNIDIKKLSKQFMANESILMPIIEAALARKLAAEKAAETKANKAAAKAKVAKHIKPNKYGDEKSETTLHLTEGDSAIGFLLATRNQELHGGYPLRGKFMNTWGMKPSDMLKNQEVFDICAITGLTFGEKAENLNYRNIAIMTDADVDGQGSIYPSLLAFFSNWPELFEQGRIRFVKTPVAIAEKNKKQEWFYNLKEYEEAKATLKGYKFRYIKGLGSLEEDEYERVINQPVYEVVSLPENWKDQFELLFGKEADPRKEWMSS